MNKKKIGRICLQRNITNHVWFQDHKLMILFLYCISTAEPDDCTKVIEGKRVTIERGSFYTSKSEIAKTCGFSLSYVDRGLKKLAEAHSIRTCVRTIRYKKTYLTVCNYNKYQIEISEKKQGVNQESNQDFFLDKKNPEKAPFKGGSNQESNHEDVDVSIRNNRDKKLVKSRIEPGIEPGPDLDRKKGGSNQESNQESNHEDVDVSIRNNRDKKLIKSRIEPGIEPRIEPGPDLDRKTVSTDAHSLPAEPTIEPRASRIKVLKYNLNKSFKNPLRKAHELQHMRAVIDKSEERERDNNFLNIFYEIVRDYPGVVSDENKALRLFENSVKSLLDCDKIKTAFKNLQRYANENGTQFLKYLENWMFTWKDWVLWSDVERKFKKNVNLRKPVAKVVDWDEVNKHGQ